MLTSGIAQINKAFNKTKNLIKGLRYNGLGGTNKAGRSPPDSNKLNTFSNVYLHYPKSQGDVRLGQANKDLFKEVVKAGRTSAPTVARSVAVGECNPFAPLFEQGAGRDKEVGAVVTEHPVNVVVEQPESAAQRDLFVPIGERTGDLLLALGYSLELDKTAATKLRDALSDLGHATLDKAARWLMCRAVVDYGRSKVTAGLTKGAEFSLYLRKDSDYQAFRPQLLRGGQENRMFQKRRDVVLAALGLKAVDEIGDENGRVFARKVITDLSNIWNKFNWDCELRDGFSVRHAAGDGACLFNSLCMSAGLEPKEYSGGLRQILCDGLEDDPETSKMFEALMDGQKLDNYVKSMRLPGTYGTHLEISMFNKIFGVGVTIYIVGQESVCKKVEDDSGKNEMIYLRLATYGGNSNLNHYDMLIPKGEVISDRVKNRILTRIAYKNTALGVSEGEVEASYLSRNFTVKESVHGGNNCVFEAICSTFATLDLLHTQVRCFLVSLVNDDDIDKFAQYYLCRDAYKSRLVDGKGGDFEFFLLSRWARCKIIIFETCQSKMSKTAVHFDGNNDFTLFFERRRLAHGLHVVALTPKCDEYYVDFQKFANKGEELNKILVGLMLGGSVADNIDRLIKEDPKHRAADDSGLGDSLIDGLIGEIDQLRENDQPKAGKANLVEEPKMAPSGGGQEEILVEDIGKESRFLRADTVEVALPELNWNSSVRVGPGKTGLTAFDYRRAFGLDLLPKFEVYRDELRDEVLNEENVRELRKNIQTEEEYEVEMISRRFVIPDRVLKLIGPCICMKCSCFMENGKAAFRLLDTFYDLKDHAKRSHDRKIPAGCIINTSFPESAKVHMVRGGNWKQYWLLETCEEGHRTIPEEEPKVEKDIEAPNMDGVEFVDKESVKFKEKKPSFNFIADPIRVVRGSELWKYFEFRPNKDRADKADKLDADFIPAGSSWNSFRDMCKGKKEHNAFSDEELLRFRDTLPKNVRLSQDVSSSSFFKLDTGFRDATTKTIGPCLDIDCSGFSMSGKPIYRIFSTLFEHKKHGGRQKLHGLSEGTILNLERPAGWEYYKLENGNTTYYYMKEAEASDHEANTVLNKGNRAGGLEESLVPAPCGLHIVGHNATTICSKENNGLFNIYLNDLYNRDKTAILMLNEVGKIGCSKVLDKSLKDKYAILGTGTRTAIVYDRRLKVNMIMDKLNDHHNQIAVVTNLDKQRLILYNVYVAPGTDHRARLDGAKLRLRAIFARYKDAKVVIFGDFNLKRTEMKKLFLADFKGDGVKCHMDESINSFTRCRNVLDSVQYNYLDYFVTAGIGSCKFEICKPIAKSDHMSLKLEVPNSELGSLIVKKELRYDFNGPKNDSADIAKKLLEIFTEPDKLKKMTCLVSELRAKYKPKCKKVKKCFTFKENVERLVDQKAGWKVFGDAIRKISNEEYSNFMLEIAGLKIKRNLKEYFVKMRFYSEMSKSASTLTDLEEYVPDEDMINLITSKLEIDDKVYAKYSKMFDDKGTKEVYPPVDQATMAIQGWEVSNALGNVSFDKAISWDYIPGIAFKEIYDLKKKDVSGFDRCCSGIAELLTELLKGDEPIPDELFCARLLCLNKCPDSNGKLENIRPISIIGVLMKLMERVIQGRVEMWEALNEIKISKAQVGFVKGLGCDVNIMRLRQRVYDLKFLRTKEEKYVFFIDLKAAYDSVNHRKLFSKMEGKGYSLEIINAIRVIYSSAKMRLNTLQKHINVNRGVLQGGILSPWLFNIYIDDLVRSLKDVSFEVLAYADDLAVICKNKEELDKVIDCLENWATTNEIDVNKKKSGILIIDNDRNNMHRYKGYPIKVTYKYLGMKLNGQLSPMTGLEETKKKLEVYLMRSNWINKSTLTPKSLINLSMYYQRSRVIYGMSCFLDLKGVIEAVERGNLQYTKSILGLSNQVNSDRLRIVLNRPLDRHSLWALMRKNMRKYKSHFGDEPWIYNKIDCEYEKWLCKVAGKDKAAGIIKVESEDYGKFKWYIGDYSIKSMAMEDGLEIADHYRGTHNKKYFMAWDKRDGHMIRYLVNHGFFKARIIPVCKHCGEANSRTHVTNTCPAFDDLRARAWKKLNELRRPIIKVEDRYDGDLEKAFLDAYFKPRSNCDKELEVLKSFAIQLAIANSEISITK